MFKVFEQKLALRESKGNLRQLSPNSKAIDFCSNDYLGFARSDKLQEDTIALWKKQPYKNGATGSRLISGNSSHYQKLENYIASLHGYQAALLFPTGFTANFALMATILQQSETVLYDSMIHASTKMGIIHSKAKAFAFRHNDFEHLEKKLKLCTGTTYVCVESINSMSGKINDLNQLTALCQYYGAKVIIDEAHSIGLIGPQGKGLVASFGLQQSIFCQINTFGKAFGIGGAAILGSQLLIDYLINFSVPFIYSTALSPVQLCAIHAAYEYVLQAESLRTQLMQVIAYFSHTSMTKSQCSNNEGPIQLFAIKGNNAVKNAAQKLLKNGFWVKPIMSPTVKRGEERLRICLHAFNTKDQIDQLLDIL